MLSAEIFTRVSIFKAIYLKQQQQKTEISFQMKQMIYPTSKNYIPSHMMTMKMRSRSYKSNQLFTLSKCCTYESLTKSIYGFRYSMCTSCFY